MEKTVIDRCVHQIYQKYFEDPRPENMPLLQDLYEALLKQEEKEARHVATALEIYVTGSLNIFNHRTNVDITNRIVCFDIKDLGKQMKKIGMLVVQDQVWGRVTQNRSAGKGHPVFHGRVPSAPEGGADGGLLRGDLETVPQMGRHPHRHHPECEGPALQPGSGEHLWCDTLTHKHHAMRVILHRLMAM